MSLAVEGDAWGSGERRWHIAGAKGKVSVPPDGGPVRGSGFFLSCGP